MKTTACFAYGMIAIAALCAGGCGHMNSLPIVTGSGTVVEQQFDVTPFDSLSIASSFDVVVHDGDEPQMVIRADDNLFDYIIAEQKDNTVYLSMKSGYAYRDTDLTVEITVPELKTLDVKGGVVATFNDVSTESLQVTVAGAAKLRGDLDVQQLTIDVSGAAKITLEASGDRVADSVTIKASGAATADMDKLPAKQVTVGASGACKFHVRATESLDARLSGACMLTYAGHPNHIKKRLAGAIVFRQKSE